MKKLLTILFSLICVAGVCQFPSNPTSSNVNTNTINQGAGTFNRGLVIVNFIDTGAANAVSYMKGVPYIIISTNGGVLWQRNSTATRWIQIGGGSTPVTCATGLITGGIVTYDSGLTFLVSAATYGINGTCYASPDASVTLTTADPTFNRIDAIVLTASNTVAVVTGMPSATPAIPSINPSTQLFLTAVLVPAGSSTIPTASSKILWDQNTGAPEYTGAASGITASFTNTVDPYHLTIATSAGAFTDGNTITYTGTSYSLDDYNTIRFFIKLKSAFAGASMSVQLMSGGLPTTTPYLIPANYLNTTSYQNISIPFSDLNYFGINAGNPVDGVRFILNGINATGFYLDYITLNGGVSNGSSPYVENVFRKEGTDSLFQTKNGINYFVSLIDTNSFNGYIPLSGTEVGKPITGDIETSDGIQFFTMNADGLNRNSILLRNNFALIRSINESGETSIISSSIANAVQINASVAGSPGLSGLQDFTPNITDLDYTQKKYVDSVVAASAGGGGVQTVTGNVVDNSDPLNPVITAISDTSLIQAQIAQLNSGKVSSVTANAPITSSGGTTPVISADTSKNSAVSLVTYGKLKGDSLVAAAATALKFNTTDTTNKWVQRAFINATGDSMIEVKNGVRLAYKINSSSATTDSILALRTANIAQNTIITHFGDSYTVGQGATTTAKRFTSTIDEYLGLVEDNRGISGTGAFSVAGRSYTLEPLLTTKPITVLFGVNDIFQNNSTNMFEKIKAGHRAVYANHFLKTAVAANNGSVTTSGTWTTVAAGTFNDKASLSLSGLARQSSVAGSTLTYTSNGQSLVVGCWGTDNTAGADDGRFTVTVDGVLKTTYDPANKTKSINSTLGQTRQPNAVILLGLGGGNHTIVITTLDNKPTLIDYIGVMTGQNSAPPIVVGSLVKILNTEYARAQTTYGATINDGTFDSIDVAVKSVIAEFVGYPIRMVNTNKYILSKIDNFVSLDLHPNDLGHANIARSFIEGINVDAMPTGYTYDRITLNGRSSTVPGFFRVSSDNGSQLTGLVYPSAQSVSGLIAPNNVFVYSNTSVVGFGSQASGSTVYIINNDPSLGSSAVSATFVGGKTRLGDSQAPIAVLDLKAGTTALAPIRMPAGALLTTPISGTLENDASGKLNYTDASVHRGVVQVNKTGSTDDTKGVATLVAGTVTVNTTAALTASNIQLTAKTIGGVQGFLSYTIVNATSFTINSSSPTETSTISWVIIN